MVLQAVEETGNDQARRQGEGQGEGRAEVMERGGRRSDDTFRLSTRSLLFWRKVRVCAPSQLQLLTYSAVVVS